MHIFKVYEMYEKNEKNPTWPEKEVVCLSVNQRCESFAINI